MWDEVRAPPRAQHSGSTRAITAHQLQALVRSQTQKSSRICSAEMTRDVSSLTWSSEYFPLIRSRSRMIGRTSLSERTMTYLISLGVKRKRHGGEPALLTPCFREAQRIRPVGGHVARRLGKRYVAEGHHREGECHVLFRRWLFRNTEKSSRE